MTVIHSLLLAAVVEGLLEGLAWGFFGYVLFRYLGMRRSIWYVDFILVVALCTIWNVYIGSVASTLDISIGNDEAIAFIGADLDSFFDTDFIDVAFYMLEVGLGYFLGWLFLRKLQRS